MPRHPYLRARKGARLNLNPARGQMGVMRSPGERMEKQDLSGPVRGQDVGACLCSGVLRQAGGWYLECNFTQFYLSLGENGKDVSLLMQLLDAFKFL